MIGGAINAGDSILGDAIIDGSSANPLDEVLKKLKYLLLKLGQLLFLPLL